MWGGQPPMAGPMPIQGGFPGSGAPSPWGGQPPTANPILGGMVSGVPHIQNPSFGSQPPMANPGFFGGGINLGALGGYGSQPPLRTLGRY